MYTKAGYLWAGLILLAVGSFASAQEQIKNLPSPMTEEKPGVLAVPLNQAGPQAAPASSVEHAAPAVAGAPGCASCGHSSKSCCKRFCDWLCYRPLYRTCCCNCPKPCAPCCYPPLYTYFLPECKGPSLYPPDHVGPYYTSTGWHAGTPAGCAGCAK
jgi:hypothetical protein